MARLKITESIQMVEPSNEEVARLAYSFFENDGYSHGHDVAHWLKAKEILSEVHADGQASLAAVAPKPKKPATKSRAKKA